MELIIRAKIGWIAMVLESDVQQACDDQPNRLPKLVYGASYK